MWISSHEAELRSLHSVKVVDLRAQVPLAKVKSFYLKSLNLFNFKSSPLQMNPPAAGRDGNESRPNGVSVGRKGSLTDFA